MGYSDTNVDLDMKITISARNITPQRAAEIVARESSVGVADVDVSTKISTTAAWIDDTIARSITLDQIGEHLGSRASDEALIVVIADTYREAALVLDAIEAHSRSTANHGDVDHGIRVNGNRSVHYRNGARVRATVTGADSGYSADMVVVVPGTVVVAPSGRAHTAYTDAALMTNEGGSVRSLITEIPGVAGAPQDGAAS